MNSIFGLSLRAVAILRACGQVLALLLELLLFLQKRLGIKLKYEHLPWRQSDQKFFVADNSKAEKLIGWTPKMSKEQGIEDTIAWESR